MFTIIRESVSMKSDGYHYLPIKTSLAIPFMVVFVLGIIWSVIHNCTFPHGFQHANLSYDRPSDEVSKLLANHAELIFLEVTCRSRKDIRMANYAISQHSILFVLEC